MRSIAFLLLFGCAALHAAADKAIRLETVPPHATLRGAGASQQFLAIATYASGVTRDVTTQVTWKVSDPKRASLSTDARVASVADGPVTVTAELEGLRAKSEVNISESAVARPFRFARDIGGVFTKRGCNSAMCHGGVKGQGGFKLSANALFPKDDYDWIVKGGKYQVLSQETGDRTPRIDVANPEKSLLLLKSAGKVPHGGGKRMDIDSPDYQLMLNWVREKAPYGDESGGPEPKLTRLEVYPPVVTIPVEGSRRLLVTAYFSDGRSEDYTNQVLYSSNDGDVAEVNSAGNVTAKRRGETAILVRAPGLVASAGVGIVGPPLARYPQVTPFNFIDEPVLKKLKQFNLAPSEIASDSEFIRRVCLDLTGTLPPVERTREFLASKDPRKREKLVDTILGSPEFVDYWTFRFSDIFRVAIFANGLTPKWSQKYWEWIRANVESNRPYDEVARERLSAQGYGPASRHFLPYNQIGPPADVMAEEVRVFFGRRLDCAQCHNHPYENWSQDQFWGMAAFFSRLFKMGPVVFDHPSNMDLSSHDVDGKIELLHPRTKAVVKPALLDNSKLDVAPASNPRKELARWMTNHPYFAEASVNRMWGYFFARGIVDPVDDFRSTNPPTHPDLLAALAKDFRDSGYNLRRLMKTIVLSRTYQTTNRPTDNNREDRVNYSHSIPRAIDAEVLLDGVVSVSEVPETFATAVAEGGAVGQAPVGTRAINLKDPDMFFSRFLELYGRPNRGAIPERSGKPNLAQALHMLAGDTYVDRLGEKRGRLARLLAARAADAKIIEDFYLAAFCRFPTPEESQELQQILARRPDRETGLREFVWALISSREFAENH